MLRFYYIDSKLRTFSKLAWLNVFEDFKTSSNFWTLVDGAALNLFLLLLNLLLLYITIYSQFLILKLIILRIYIIEFLISSFGFYLTVDGQPVCLVFQFFQYIYLTYREICQNICQFVLLKNVTSSSKTKKTTEKKKWVTLKFSH